MKGALRPFLGREGAWGRLHPRPSTHPGARVTPLESWLLCPGHRPGPDDASQPLSQDVCPQAPGPLPSTARPAWGSQLPEPTRLWTMAGNAGLRPRARPATGALGEAGGGCARAQAPSLGPAVSRGGRVQLPMGLGCRGLRRWVQVAVAPRPTPTQASGSYARLHPPRMSPSSRPRWVHGAERRGLWIAPGHSGMLPPMAYWV